MAGCCLFPLLLSLPFIFILHRHSHASVGPAGIKNNEFGVKMATDGRFGELFGSPLSLHSQFLFLTNLNVGNGQPVIQPLNAFFERFFAGEKSIEKAQWDFGLPSELERRQMRKLILFLFQLDNFGPIAANPSFLSQFVPILAKSIQLTFVQDCFCIVHESLPHSPLGRFRRFWGYFVLNSRGHSRRPNIHHSAPHFQSDGNVCNEAAAIFERTNSRSLVIAGASRFAVRGNYSAPCQPKNALADAAHNNETMFHTICTALLDATKMDAGGEDIFMQWHGMANSSADSSAFLSVGADGAHPIYAKANSSVNRLVSVVNGFVGFNVASTPAEDKSCRLIATNNVFGRIVNGAPARQSCHLPAKAKNILGQFIHIEQKREMSDNWVIKWRPQYSKFIPHSDALVKCNQ